MLKKDANKIVGGLSRPGKMPCYSINLPATACITGAKLVKVAGSVCSGCYALKGRYRFKPNKLAMERRRQALTDARWIQAMTALITGHKYFRWHDSGDLQSVEHLKNIFEVCKATPGTQHWLPTREARFLKLMDPEIVPKNLIIRLSAHSVDRQGATWWPWTSTVVTKDKDCPAAEQDNQCKSCRACWNRDVKNVAYGKH